MSHSQSTTWHGLTYPVPVLPSGHSHSWGCQGRNSRSLAHHQTSSSDTRKPDKDLIWGRPRPKATKTKTQTISTSIFNDQWGKWLVTQQPSPWAQAKLHISLVRLDFLDLCLAQLAEAITNLRKQNVIAKLGSWFCIHRPRVFHHGFDSGSDPCLPKWKEEKEHLIPKRLHSHHQKRTFWKLWWWLQIDYTVALLNSSGVWWMNNN